MICNHCGNYMEDNSNFCPSCGARPEPSPQQNPEYAPMSQPYSDPATNQPVYNQPSYDPYNINPGYNPAQPGMMPNGEIPGKGQGTASLILGIVGILGSSLCNCLCGCIGGAPGLICAIIGLIMGIQAKNKATAAGTTNSQANVGFILSIVAIALFVVVSIINAILGGTGFYQDLSSNFYY